MAERLGKGLQNLLQRFDSASHLSKIFPDNVRKDLFHLGTFAANLFCTTSPKSDTLPIFPFRQQTLRIYREYRNHPHNQNDAFTKPPQSNRIAVELAKKENASDQTGDHQDSRHTFAGLDDKASYLPHQLRKDPNHPHRFGSPPRCPGHPGRGDRHPLARSTLHLSPAFCHILILQIQPLNRKARDANLRQHAPSSHRFNAHCFYTFRLPNCAAKILKLFYTLYTLN